jgi:hypothetical protein
MVFEITAKGTMIIWGIQGLGAHPHRTTRVNLIMRSEKTVLPKDSEFFGRDMIKFVSKSTQMYHAAPELVLLGRSSIQVMHAYFMNLDDFFNQNWVAPRLALSHSWCGPKRPLLQTSKSPSGGYLATFDVGGG